MELIHFPREYQIDENLIFLIKHDIFDLHYIFIILKDERNSKYMCSLIRKIMPGANKI